MIVTAIKSAFALLSAVLLSGQQNPASIDVPVGAHSILAVKGEGFQIYTCARGEQGDKWVLKAPEAKLLDPAGKVVGEHFAGPSWKLLDGGAVQGELMASHPSPDPDSVAWLLLRAKPGTATGSLAATDFIRRTNTHGGAAGSTGCLTEVDVGKVERIAYTADYTFYSTR
jgi:hypothetical protein